MKNITLSVDEDVLATVRRYALEHDSSVNRMVREYLTGIAEREDRVKKARNRIQQLSNRPKARIGRKDWTREDLHDR